MSRYDGLIIPRSYNEYINKTDPVAMLQALQLNNVMDDVPTQNSNHPAQSGGIFAALSDYIKNNAEALSAALQLNGVLSNTVQAGDNKPVKSDAVNTKLGEFIRIFGEDFTGDTRSSFIVNLVAHIRNNISKDQFMIYGAWSGHAYYYAIGYKYPGGLMAIIPFTDNILVFTNYVYGSNVWSYSVQLTSL